MDKFLGRHRLTKLSEEKTENLNRSTTRNQINHQKFSHKEKLGHTHMATLVNPIKYFKKKLTPVLMNSFRK